MASSHNRKRIMVVTTVCVTYLFLTSFYHHIDKYTARIIFVLLTLLIPALFLAIFVYFIKG